MRAIVEAPDLRRASHGLVETAARGDSAGRWENGVTFTPHGCHVVFGHVPGCPGESKSDFQECSLVEADAWLLETGLVWATGDLEANPKEIVRETLDIGTSSVLERLTEAGIVDTAAGSAITAPDPVATVVAGGIIGRLMDGATMPPTLAGTAVIDAGPYAALDAAGRVEAKLLDASDHVGSAGTLLMSPVHAVHLQAIIAEDGNGRLYTTTTGSTVIVGNFEPGTIWGVVGDVDVYLSDIEVYEAYDRAANEYAVRAERYALAVWNCNAFGAGVGAGNP